MYISAWPLAENYANILQKKKKFISTKLVTLFNLHYYETSEQLQYYAAYTVCVPFQFNGLTAK